MSDAARFKSIRIHPLDADTFGSWDKAHSPIQIGDGELIARPINRESFKCEFCRQLEQP
jgi:hypothetical protein